MKISGRIKPSTTGTKILPVTLRPIETIVMQISLMLKVKQPTGT